MIKPSLAEVAVGKYNYVLGNGEVFAQPNPMLFREVYKRRGIDDLPSSLWYQTEFMNIESLGGRQNILILPDGDQDILETQRAQVNEQIQTIVDETELPLPFMSQPLYIDFDIYRSTPDIMGTIRRYRNHPEVLGQLAACLADPGRLEMNQAGHFHEDVLTAVHAIFPHITVHPDFQRRIYSSVHFVDKTVSVDLVTNAPAIDLPQYASSRTCSVEEVLTARSFEELNGSTETIVVKLGPDSGGEGVFLVRPYNFEIFRQKLLNLPDQSMRCMIQETVNVPQKSPNGLPTRTSLDFVINGKKTEYVGSAGQISADDECTEYLGSLWSGRDDEAVRQAIGPDKLQNLCNLYGEQGYIGPIGFDFLMNENGEYTYIFDCNPRRTANQYVYNLKDYMYSKGMPLATLANVGRSGLFKTPSLRETMDYLRQKNALMTANTPQGTILLPHLNGGFDVHFANFEDPEQILEWGEALKQHDVHFPSLYL